MTRRLLPWVSLLVILLFCGGVIGGLIYWRSRSSSNAKLLTRLPSEGVVAFIDFGALRGAGTLDALFAAPAAQEPEYLRFVERTGFDYLRDLDSALISVTPRGTYLLVRGRFNWKSLTAYAQSEGGVCSNAFCRVQGSTETRRISFFPVQQEVMALAVSQDEWAALSLNEERRPAAAGEIPEGVAWVVIPAAALKDASRLPAGTRAFARPLQDASRITLWLGLAGGRFALNLDVTCGSPESAAALAGELRSAAEWLRSLIAREGQTPNPLDLSGVLATGVFEQKGTRVTGRWPIEREFLDALTRGL